MLILGKEPHVHRHIAFLIYYLRGCAHLMPLFPRLTTVGRQLDSTNRLPRLPFPFATTRMSWRKKVNLSECCKIITSKYKVSLSKSHNFLLDLNTSFQSNTFNCSYATTCQTIPWILHDLNFTCVWKTSDSLNHGLSILKEFGKWANFVTFPYLHTKQLWFRNIDEFCTQIPLILIDFVLT